VRLQGKIAAHSRHVAKKLETETRWPKYVVYEVIIDLALDSLNIVIPKLNINNMMEDSLNTSRFNLDGVRETAFRRKFEIAKPADFFRQSMNSGAYLIDWFLDNRLPESLSQQEIYESISSRLGKNQKYTTGLEKLKAMITSL
jgi:hypothetical protein